MRKSNDGIDWFRDISGWVIILVLMLASCSTLNKDQKHLAQINARNPQLIAGNCADKFPVVPKEGKPIIQYLPADNKDYTGKIDSLSDALNWMRSLYQGAIDAHKGDTSCQNTIRQLQNRNDSLFRAFTDFKGKYIPCKPDTLRITKTDTIPDFAAIAVRDAQISDLKADRDNWESKAKNRAKWIWYLSIGLAISVGWNFRKLILKMFV